VNLSRPSHRYLPPLVLAATLFSVYLATTAAGLTWANGGSDGGDLITAAAVGGVPHPTGYPVYLVLARLFQFLPIGSLAYRTNLLSAASTVAAAVLVYAIIRRLLEPVAPRAAAWGGFVGGLAFGLSPLVWSQAVITEVYSLNLLLTAALFYLLTAATSRPYRIAFAVGLVQGLAIGNHLLSGLLLPATLALMVIRRAGNSTATRTSGTW